MKLLTAKCTTCSYNKYSCVLTVRLPYCDLINTTGMSHLTRFPDVQSYSMKEANSTAVVTG